MSEPKMGKESADTRKQLRVRAHHELVVMGCSTKEADAILDAVDVPRWKRRALRAEALLVAARECVRRLDAAWRRWESNAMRGAIDNPIPASETGFDDLIVRDPAALVRLVPELADIINPILEEYGE